MTRVAGAFHRAPILGEKRVVGGPPLPGGLRVPAGAGDAVVLEPALLQLMWLGSSTGPTSEVDAEEAFDDALDGISEGVTRDGDMLRAMRSMNKLKGPRLRRSAPTLLGYAEPACTLFAIGAS